MPGGGTLTIATSNVEVHDDYARVHPGVSPGPHVLLEVTDTGTGMDRETAALVFEPFFTTKEAGRGTGLGLATVLGIVQQSGGHVWVASELGRGTTFKVYLPRSTVQLPIASAAPKYSASDTASMHGSETILLVEDDDQVRATVRTILQRHGYTVLDASGPGEALLICEQQAGAIDLLLSDVVMPRMTGPELGERIGATRHRIRQLFMSGHFDVPRMLGNRRITILQKPLTPETLIRKVREVLGQADGNPARSVVEGEPTSDPGSFGPANAV
jgi:two-component system cell cycle sensor histidine kinase/response regulator CckA